MPEPITIPGNVHEYADRTVYEATLTWLLDNGISPNAVTAARPLTLTGDVLDYWVIVPASDEASDTEVPRGMGRKSHVLVQGEEWTEDGEFARAIRRARTLITVPIPDVVRSAFA